MSITFFIAIEVDGPHGPETRMAYRCECSKRWCDACDAAWANNTKAPDMFFCDDCTNVELNMANTNAADWMRWIGLASGPCGEIKANELAALCRRRLWDEERNHDPALDGDDYKIDGGPRVIISDRPANYLRDQTARMLKICEKAGDRLIAWG
jgi:hypothetical protein